MNTLTNDCLYCILMKLEKKNISKLSIAFKDVNTFISLNKEYFYMVLTKRDFNIVNNYTFSWFELYKFCYNLNLTSTCKINSIVDDDNLQIYDINIEDNNKKLTGYGTIKQTENTFIETDIDFKMVGYLYKHNSLKIIGTNYFSIKTVIIGISKFEGFIDLSKYNNNNKIILSCNYYYQPLPGTESLDNKDILGKSTGICTLIK